MSAALAKLHTADELTKYMDEASPTDLWDPDRKLGHFPGSPFPPGYLATSEYFADQQASRARSLRGKRIGRGRQCR